RTCAPSSIFRRSTMSASAPAGRASKNSGRVVAACTSATSSELGDNEVISHPAPTSCIQVAMLEMIEAIHRARKTGKLSGPFAGAAISMAVILAPVGRQTELVGILKT